MSVENLMHPPKKCNCDCCCNCQPKTYGPLPTQGNNPELLKQLSVMIAKVMETGEKQTLNFKADASKPAQPKCSICNDSGQYCTGYSGDESDGNAPILERCDCESGQPSPPQPQTVASALEAAAKIAESTPALTYFQCESDYQIARYTAEAIRNLITTQPTQVQSDWISVDAKLPEVQKDSAKYFNVAVSREHDGKTYVMPAVYLNQRELTNTNTYEDVVFTGWCDVKQHYEFDDCYEKIESEGGDKVTHWMPLPAAPSIQWNTEGEK